jgi:hypothetical protein
MKTAALLTIVAMFTASVTACTSARGISPGSLAENHLLFTLHRVEGGFRGGAHDFLTKYAVSLEFRHGIPGSPLTLPALLEAIRRGEVTGVVTDPEGATTPIFFEIVRHRGPEEIYMKTSLGYFLWERVAVRDDEVSFDVDWFYTPPVREQDVEVVAMAQRLLADPTHWHKRDDRDCEEDQANEDWSLFCALKQASSEIMGEYNHHNPAMTTVRIIIYELGPDPPYEHPLMDYNNAAATTHDDILHLLATARKRLSQAALDTASD